MKKGHQKVYSLRKISLFSIKLGPNILDILDFTQTRWRHVTAVANRWLPTELTSTNCEK